ncbi:hypothetical protein [Xenorhabdus sp. BG5]
MMIIHLNEGGSIAAENFKVFNNEELYKTVRLGGRLYHASLYSGIW